MEKIILNDWVGDFYDGRRKKQREIEIVKNEDYLIKDFVKNLIHNNAFELKNTVLKSGTVSPFYINMRLMSNPESLKIITKLLTDRASKLEFDYIVAIPYAAIPFATLLAQELNKPLLYVRKEKKEYGDDVNDLIVGNRYENRKTCLLVDDVLTNGKSKYEQIEILTSAGFIVKDVLTLVDRTTKEERGNNDSYLNILMSKGVRFHTVLNIIDLIEMLCELYPEKFNTKTLKEVYEFLGFTELNYGKYNKFAKKILNVFKEKNSYIVPSADFDNSKDLIDFVEAVGPKVGLIKIHSDMINDWSTDVYLVLAYLANKNNFYLLEDRKFVDIGNTLNKQIKNQIYSYDKWANSVTVVPLGGAESIVSGLKLDNGNYMPAFLLTPMTTRGSYYSDDYIKYIEDLYVNNNDVFCGVIGGSCLTRKDIEKAIPYYIWLRPGISENRAKDDKGQFYMTIDEAYKLYGEKLTGVVIGRDLINVFKSKGTDSLLDLIDNYNQKILKYK